eukprot:10331656-Prorocentrum_lima.AAC.1
MDECVFEGEGRIGSNICPWTTIANTLDEVHNLLPDPSSWSERKLVGRKTVKLLQLLCCDP